MPAFGSCKCATKTSVGSPGSLLPTPIDSDVAVVCANGFDFSPRASQTLAVGRVTTRPCPSTTRNG